jgi:hypothetical protein
MTVVLEGKNSFFLADRAFLLGVENRELAWAEKHVVNNPALGWVLGKYVEANRENSNKQFWSLADLQIAQPTITHAPMNLLHDQRTPVGAFVATEMMFPVNDEMAAVQNPYVEALGVMWKYYFPREYQLIEAAHSSGSLYFSMECIADTITCAGENGCSSEFAYAGPISDTYCAHLNRHESTKQLNKPHFLAGALIFPPTRPGWNGAEVHDLSALVKEHQVEAEMAYEGVKSDSPHLSPKEWEVLMAHIVAHAHDEARDFNTEQRKKMAGKGQALPDGSFPIKNAGDLRNAIKLAGKAKDPGKARAHIKARAKALGLEALIPDTW